MQRRLDRADAERLTSDDATDDYPHRYADAGCHHNTDCARYGDADPGRDGHTDTDCNCNAQRNGNAYAGSDRDAGCDAHRYGAAANRSDRIRALNHDRCQVRDGLILHGRFGIERSGCSR
jgi:hypothetical protein